MPSIIEQITAAEAQAAALKKDEAAAGREAAAKAQQEAKALLEAARERGRARIAELSAKAEVEGAKLAEDIRAKNASETDEACAAASKKLPEAVGYILERVVKA